jgi:rhodanese-related sulfurtransferase
MYLIFALIGFAFGYVLEISGFGDSTKLAAQFYFKDLTVLKVMFTAIVVAMVLIFAAVGLGWLDYNQVWVNPTYLWSGIVGGLIMGVGFIIGGFCPGTSLVSMATFKIDGLFFVLGGLTGIFLFGETVGLYEDWWNGSYYGRLTIMDWLNLPTGLVVVAVVLMALFMFWGGEQLEKIFGKRDLSREPRLRVAGGLALVLASVAVLLIGAPDTADKWARVSAEKERLVAAREVQIHPGELLASLADDRLKVRMLDVRSESDFNMFHIEGAQRVDLVGLLPLTKDFLASSTENTLYVVMSNDEVAATDAWRVLTAESVPNVYILEGGINHWLSIFAASEPEIVPTPTPVASDRLRYDFPAALGSRYEGASPDPHHWELEYTPKIKLQIKRDKSGGGCG